MSGPTDPSFSDLFQVLVLLAIPALILLTLRYVNLRGERAQPVPAGRRPSSTRLRTSDEGPFALSNPVPEQETRGHARTA